MEISKDKLYFLIESLRRCDFNATEIHGLINRSWPDYCPSVINIRKRCQEFREGTRNSFERKEGSGRAKSDSRTENVDAVLALIEEDSSLTLRHIGERLQISHTIVERIIKEDLGKCWFHTKWVPHTLSDHNKVTRVERCRDMLESFSSRITKANLVTIDEKFFYCRKVAARNKIGSWLSAGGDEPLRQTARRSPMEKKFLVIIAVSQKGQHYFEVLERNQNIDAQRYMQFITNLINFLQRLPNPLNPENMRLQHDNARPHTARDTAEYLENLNVRLIRQPPYSPDVNLCDRYVFPRLEALTTQFESAEEIKNFLSVELPKFDKARMSNALEEAVKHIEKVIDAGGSYL